MSLTLMKSSSIGLPSYTDLPILPWKAINVGQASLTLVKSILAVRNHNLLLHVPRNVFQEVLPMIFTKTKARLSLWRTGLVIKGFGSFTVFSRHTSSRESFTLLPSSPLSCVFGTL